MKKWVLMLGMAVWLASCSGQVVPENRLEQSTPLDYADTVQSTDLIEELEAARLLGAKRQDVIAERGEPLMTGDIVINGKKQRSASMEYADYAYALWDGRVRSFTIVPGSSTAKGISVGDDAAQIAEQYGSHYYTRQMGSDRLQGFVDKQQDVVIEFVVRNGKVAAIIVSQLSAFR